MKSFVKVLISSGLLLRVLEYSLCRHSLRLLSSTTRTGHLPLEGGNISRTFVGMCDLGRRNGSCHGYRYNLGGKLSVYRRAITFTRLFICWLDLLVADNARCRVKSCYRLHIGIIGNWMHENVFGFARNRSELVVGLSCDRLLNLWHRGAGPRRGWGRLLDPRRMLVTIASIVTRASWTAILMSGRMGFPSIGLCPYGLGRGGRNWPHGTYFRLSGRHDDRCMWRDMIEIDNWLESR